MKLVESVISWYVIRGFMIKLVEYTREKQFIKDGARYHRNVNWILGIVESRAGKGLNNSIALVYKCGIEKKLFWFAKVLLPFRAYAGKEIIGEKLSFFQYMECSCPIGERYQTLDCVCLGWSGNDEMDHTMESETFSNEGITGMIHEWFGVDAFSSIQGTVPVLHVSYGTSQFMSELYLPEHRFYK